MNADEPLRVALVMVAAAIELRANDRARTILRTSETVEEAIAALEADTAERAAWISQQATDVMHGLLALEAKDGGRGH